MFYRVGLIGKMGAGKTYVSDKLIEEYGGARMAFADALKHDVIQYRLTTDGTIQKQRDRKLLQDYGQLRRGELEQIETPTATLLNMKGNCYLEQKNSLTYELRRNYNYIGSCMSTYWVNQLIYNIKQKPDNTSIIVDDIRRANEATALAELGFVIVKLDCPDEVRFQRLRARDGSFDPATLNNISETEVDSIPYDFVVVNDGEIDFVSEFVNLPVSYSA